VSWIVKLTIVLICFSSCGAGIFIASNARKEDTPQKTNVIPVKNREVARHAWILT